MKKKDEGMQVSEVDACIEKNMSGMRVEDQDSMILWIRTAGPNGRPETVFRGGPVEMIKTR